MNIIFKRLSESTIQDTIIAWNRGFEGYYVQMEMTPELFFNRLVNEGLSLKHSLVAFDRSVRLYEKYGYEITDSLAYLNGTLELNNTTTLSKSIRPEQLPTFHFYKENGPWQCQWQSVKSGEAQIYFDNHQKPLGYSLYKRTWNQNGQLEKVFLYQLELFSEVKKETITSIFTSISGETNIPVRFTTINFSLTNPVIPFLLELGFEKKMEQVQMVKKCNQ